MWQYALLSVCFTIVMLRADRRKRQPRRVPHPQSRKLWCRKPRSRKRLFRRKAEQPARMMFLPRGRKHPPRLPAVRHRASLPMGSQRHVLRQPLPPKRLTNPVEIPRSRVSRRAEKNVRMAPFMFRDLDGSKMKAEILKELPPMQEPAIRLATCKREYRI